ncbi:restriction system protein [Anaerobacterium chartisolvens]|uniref:Restriction system protein n=1 Tax=Anaerobacterium chartisolvens TaxID=1297424 RepID=A0A369AQF4_9FIRM|nr:restriction endonuclease [Anaerobacterium chartisolvens]RCX10447.1 restriction system protein [Anaerobacterium chartisolvens]
MKEIGAYFITLVITSAILRYLLAYPNVHNKFLLDSVAILFCYFVSRPVIVRLPGLKKFRHNETDIIVSLLALIIIIYKFDEKSATILLTSAVAGSAGFIAYKRFKHPQESRQRNNIVRIYNGSKHTLSPVRTDDKKKLNKSNFSLNSKHEAPLTREDSMLKPTSQIDRLKEQALEKTKESEDFIEEYNNILSRALSVKNKIDWHTLYNTKPFNKKFIFNEQVPVAITPHEPMDLETYMKNAGLTDKRFIENLIPYFRVKRISAEEAVKVAYNEEMKKYEKYKNQILSENTKSLEEYNSRRASAQAQYENEKSVFLQKQKEHNDSINSFRNEFENGIPEAIEKYLSLVLYKPVFPYDNNKDLEIAFEPISGAAILSYWLPDIDNIPKINGYKFVQVRKTIEPIYIKQKELDTFYESVIFQIALVNIHKVFDSVYTNFVKSVVFNGWVKGIDKSTGNEFTSCIISCQVSKEVFQSFNLSRICPRECIRSLKGLTAGPLAAMAPVKPIMEINREDSRFVESKEVLAGINSIDNLATMDWEDFEHLVRELFSKIFSKDGAEVKVTQASRDGGVDAIAFDPDPIRGGKFVIQAKRYNNVVSVSAVRDLYGTMINEGAVKGILVTTSYYGNDAREFSKDKPITLIDGSNLVHMFQEYGYDVKIELQKKG